MPTWEEIGAYLCSEPFLGHIALMQYLTRLEEHPYLFLGDRMGAKRSDLPLLVASLIDRAWLF